MISLNHFLSYLAIFMLLQVASYIPESTKSKEKELMELARKRKNKSHDTPRAADEKPLSILVEYEDLMYVTEDSCISLRSMLISSFVSESQTATQVSEGSEHLL